MNTSEIEKVLKDLENLINVGSRGRFIIRGYVVKELVGNANSFRFIVYSNDHNPAHFHVESKDGSVKAKYSIDPFTCLGGGNSRLNKMVEDWFSSEVNRKRMLVAWEKTKAAMN